MTTRVRNSRFNQIVAEDENPAAPPPVPEDDVDFDAFSESEKEVINALKKSNKMTRMAAYYYARFKTTPAFAFKPLPELTDDEFSSMVISMAILGSRGMDGRPIGAVDKAVYDRYKTQNVDLIKAALVGEKVKAVETFTDVTLGHMLRHAYGVTLHDDKMPGTALLRVPGWEVGIRVSTMSPHVGKVLLGATAYLQWRHDMEDKPFMYVEIHPDARIIARSIVSRYIMSYSNHKVGITTRPSRNSAKAESIGLKIPPFPRIVEKMEAYFLDQIKEFLGNDFSPPSGLSAKNEPIELLAWILHRMRDEDEECKKEMGTYAGKIKEYLGSVRVAIRAVVASIKEEKVFNGESVGIGALPPRLTHGSIATFVKRHRSEIRSDPASDVPRKSDSTNLGRVLGAASSVPEKIKRALALLKLSSKVDVHAYGTETNWMRKEVLNVASTVKWFDIDPKNAVEGEDFQVADILKLHPRSGRGKVLVDDTHVDNNEAKLCAIFDADYDAFVSKIHIGKGDPTVLLGQNSMDAIDRLSQVYHLTYSMGGGAHSTEYFIVGRKNEKPSEAMMDDFFDAAIAHGALIIKSNIWRSAQVMAGGLFDHEESVVLPESGLSMLYLAGKKGSKAPTVDLPTPSIPDVIVRKSRFGKSAPLSEPSLDGGSSKDSLNGNQGEATNTDDVAFPFLRENVEEIRGFLATLDPLKLKREYPPHIVLGDPWVMNPPARGKGDGIKLGGGILDTYRGVDYRRGTRGAQTVHVFSIRDGPRLCYLGPSQRHADFDLREKASHDAVLALIRM